MKFLKTKNISKFSISDNTFIAYPSGEANKTSRVVVDAVGGLLLPKGRGPFLADGITPDPNGADQRPKLTGVRQPTDANGTIRYNTSTKSIEAYIDNVWEVVRAPGASAITKEQFGPGDDVSTIFGPLNPAFVTAYSASNHNVLVLVDNVFQIAPANFEVVQNPSTTGTGAEILTGSFVPTKQYVITNVGDTNFTAIGASANTVGTIFTATGIGGGTTGKARLAGYYVKFTSAVPSLSDLLTSVYVTVYHGYAN